MTIARLARPGIFRWSRRDGWLVAAAIAQGVVLALALHQLPALGSAGFLAASALFASSLWWGSNTVSHNHLHNPLFSSRALNQALTLYLSVLYAVPQSIWKERHLAHHAGSRARPRRGLPRGAVIELGLIGFVWGAVGASAPRVLASAALGYAVGMALCRLQGDMEHALSERPERGISHYGRLYNLLWFNDGHHAEHHCWPGLHWTRLPERKHRIEAPESAWSPALRWLEGLSAAPLLGALERLPFVFTPVRRFMIDTHLRAFRRVIEQLPAEPKTIGIVGGGLFPRTVIVLGRLLPDARLVVIDKSADNVERARDFLTNEGHELDRVQFRIESFDPARHGGFDLLVLPLAFVGDRTAIFGVQGFVVTHDWLWRRVARTSAVVSWLIVKRLNLHRPAIAHALPAELGRAA